MTNEKQDTQYTSFFPPTPTSERRQSNRLIDDEPPEQPDWLLIFMGVLFLASVLIAWLVDFPSLMDKP